MQTLDHGNKIKVKSGHRRHRIAISGSEIAIFGIASFFVMEWYIKCQGLMGLCDHMIILWLYIASGERLHCLTVSKMRIIRLFSMSIDLAGNWRVRAHPIGDPIPKVSALAVHFLLWYD